MRGEHDHIDFSDVASTYDVVVIGGGPAGCGTAACFASRGASVLLVESNPNAARRFAGEWIHPEGARVLEAQGLLEGLGERVEARGFVVCANDGLGPVRLEYPDDARGFACEHEVLVRHLRGAVGAMPGVDYVEGVRAFPLRGSEVEIGRRSGPSGRVSAGRVVMAAGRSSAAATEEGALDRFDRVPISWMAGLLLEDATLPIDGYGHVILGGLGPVLAYRIDERRVRLCLDIPHEARSEARNPQFLWDSFADVLPDGLRAPVRKALQGTTSSWAANAFRPRCYATDDGVARVGDAAGVFHPLTAMGITMALLDGEALADARDLDGYASKRTNESYIPELLSNAIYQAFARDDLGSEAIRTSILESWRANARHRDRTMRLLGASSTRRADFVRAFCRVAAHAGKDALMSDHRTLPELARWLRWPWASVHPQPSSVRRRSLSWAAPNTWGHPTFLRASNPLPERRHAN